MFSVETRAPRIFLICTIGVANDAHFVPHFLHHYLDRVGVDPANMLIVLHAASPDDPQLDLVADQLQARGITPARTHGAFNTFDKYEYQVR